MSIKNYRKSTLNTIIGLFSFAACMGISNSKAQAFETFYVREGMALNTNMTFRLFDTKPRVSIYQRNDSDRDQQFERFPGNRGGILLRNRSTGMCLNAHHLYEGAEMNTWPCDANDPDQNWNLVDVGDGWNLIKRAGTSMCVDTPTRNNAGKVHLWTCNSNNSNQRWKSSAPPRPVNQISPIETPLSQYEVWIVARKPENSSFPSFSGEGIDAGHAWITLVRQDYLRVQTFRNGILQTDVNVFKDGWKVDTTYAFWKGKTLTIGDDKNQNSDFKDTNKIIKGESISKRGFAVRKAKISTNRANWIKKGAFREAGCTTYKLVGGTDEECNCADYATREWWFLTSQWDDFRIRAFTGHTLLILRGDIYNGTWQLRLDNLVNEINQKNRATGGDFLDGGRVGQ
jgi:hypothetical protein